MSLHNKHSGIGIKEKCRVLGKAWKVSIRMKSRMSLLVCLLGFGMAFVPAGISLILEKFSDDVQGLAEDRGSFSSVFGLLILLILCYGIQLAYDFMNAYVAEEDKLMTAQYIKKKIIECTCRVPYGQVESSGKFREQIAFAESYAGGKVAESMQSLIRVLQYLITFLSTSYVLININSYIVILLIATCIPAAALAAVQKDETYRANTKWMEEGMWVIHEFFMCCGAESLNEVRHLQLFEYLKKKWKSYAEGYKDKKNALTKKHVIYNSIADILRNAVYIAVLLLAAYEIYRNPALGVGVFMLVLHASVQLQNVTAKMVTTAIQLYTDIYFMKDFFDLETLYAEDGMGKDTETDTATDRKRNAKTNMDMDEKRNAKTGMDMDEKRNAENCEICFSNVSFCYPRREEEALKQISVRIGAGEKVAIVGENGSGKTTFVNLLCGLYTPQRGGIFINEKEVSGKLKTLRNWISVVFQDFGRYEESVRRNVSVSEPKNEKKDKFLFELLKTAGLEEFVRQLPNGLDEKIGTFSENGKNLSGGQWQKLALARALNRTDAKIMILDEPTAALDPVAETELYRNFTNVTGKKTTLLISHRLGVARLADRILVFQDGRIIEDGSHERLMELEGEYARMYRAQAHWYA